MFKYDYIWVGYKLSFYITELDSFQIYIHLLGYDFLSVS